MRILCEVAEGATRWEQVVGTLEENTSQRPPPNPHGEWAEELRQMTTEGGGVFRGAGGSNLWWTSGPHS